MNVLSDVIISIGLALFIFGACCADSPGYIAYIIVAIGIAMIAAGYGIKKFKEDFENEKQHPHYFGEYRCYLSRNTRYFYAYINRKRGKL